MPHAKTVYICSPLRGDYEKNQERAREYCAAAIKAGFLPIAPHIYLTQFLDDNNQEDRARALDLGLQMLSRCDELWVCGTDEPTEGMIKEIERAKLLAIPILDTNDFECIARKIAPRRKT